MEALERQEWPRTELEIQLLRSSLFTVQAMARDMIAAGREGELEQIRRNVSQMAPELPPEPTIMASDCYTCSISTCFRAPLPITMRWQPTAARSRSSSPKALGAWRSERSRTICLSCALRRIALLRSCTTGQAAHPGLNRAGNRAMASARFRSRGSAPSTAPFPNRTVFFPEP